jgi:hypothetical protein
MINAKISKHNSKNSLANDLFFKDFVLGIFILGVGSFAGLVVGLLSVKIELLIDLFRSSSCIKIEIIIASIASRLF